ncbi:MAG: hypothetical protein P4M11_15725 [Candidatus Pacebacteria bacterium]|nr:hypothetical protein [Candidatus Paceibacterota bacterium]
MLQGEDIGRGGEHYAGEILVANIEKDDKDETEEEEDDARELDKAVGFLFGGVMRETLTSALARKESRQFRNPVLTLK